MKIDNDSLIIEEQDDASLVIASLGGDREAFEKIVNRYQRLLCSLAYSALGSLNESEDVAQEAFVEAWKKLANLKEPDKLKAWLCGILRFKISHHRRKDARQPLRHADELDEAHASNDEAIEETAMREEEQALLWQALETVPETYRETLILYYREHRSVEHVACELDLTEDAVRQRLSRGRKLLQEKMMTFVEGALERSAPKQVFTAAVLAAIVSFAPSAQAAGAGAGATATKLATGMKWAAIATFIATFSGLISSFFALRASLDQSRTRRERKAVIKTVAMFFGVALAFAAGMFGLRFLAVGSYVNAGFMAVLSQVLVVAFVIGYLVMTARLLKRMRVLRSAERLRRPDLFTSPDDQPDSKKREYKSRLALLGFPLVHAKFGMPEEGDPPAVGWIAAGDRAYGLLFAWGGYAVAPVSVGIVAIGLIGVGAIGLGPIAIGTVGIGLLAMGASAIGFKAYGSLSAMGWESAFSPAFSIAKEAAIGPVAFANEVNNELAASITNLSTVDQSHAWILGMMAILVIVPVVWWSHVVRKKMRKAKEK